MSLLKTEKLSFSFNKKDNILTDIDLSIKTNEVVLLAGANGSGKTVLTRLLTGLYPADEGMISYDGRPLKKQLNKLRQEIGLLFQEAEHQIVGQTVLEDVLLGPRNLGIAEKEALQMARLSLKENGLIDKEDRLPYTLSGGEKKRLALASALVMRPRMLIMDEPFNSLDYKGCLDLLLRIQELAREGIGLIIISHDLEKIIGLCERIIILGQGKILLDDCPSAIFKYKSQELGVKIPQKEQNWKDISWLP